MICNLSSQMTHKKCRALRNPVRCVKCPGPGTIVLTFNEEVYQVLDQLAKDDGKNVADAVKKLLHDLVAMYRAHFEG